MNSEPVAHGTRRDPMAGSEPGSPTGLALLERKSRRPTRIGLVAGGLGAYWP